MFFSLFFKIPVVLILGIWSKYCNKRLHARPLHQRACQIVVSNPLPTRQTMCTSNQILVLASDRPVCLVDWYQFNRQWLFHQVSDVMLSSLMEIFHWNFLSSFPSFNNDGVLISIICEIISLCSLSFFNLVNYSLHLLVKFWNCWAAKN